MALTKHTCQNSGRNTRPGSSIVELLAAVPLISLVGLIAVLLILNSQQLARKTDGHSARNRELRYAASVLATSVRNTHSADLLFWNDTLIEINSGVGIGLVCDMPTVNTVDLLPDNNTSPLSPGWSSAPDPGDKLTVALYPHTGNIEPLVEEARLTAISHATNACNNSVLRDHSQGNVLRLKLDRALNGTPLIGAPARITRQLRFSLYRGGDGGWYLGMRALRDNGWETVQPVAGPFATAAERGLRFGVVAQDGTPMPYNTGNGSPTPDSLQHPAAISLTLIAVAPWRNSNGSRDTDSLSTVIALRNK